LSAAWPKNASAISTKESAGTSVMKEPWRAKKTGLNATVAVTKLASHGREPSRRRMSYRAISPNHDKTIVETRKLTKLGPKSLMNGHAQIHWPSCGMLDQS